MDSFEAESKRTWFTIQDTLRASFKGGRLWTPAVVTLVDGSVRISTREGSVEIRPRRVRWIASNSFVIAGFSKNAKIQRSYLRFKNPEEASRAATIIKHNPSVLEQVLVSVEEFPVQLRLLVTGRSLIFLIYAIFLNIIVGSFLLLILSAFGVFGTVAGVVVLVIYAGFPLWSTVLRMGRRTQGWLRIQGTSIVVRGRDWMPVFPKTIEWRNSRTIVLEGRGAKYELSFQTDQDLAQAIAKIRTAYPGVQERLWKNYWPGVPTHS